MSTFANRENTALLVIDVQNAIFTGAWHKDEVVDNINKLVTAARVADTPVIWVQHSDDDIEIDSKPWQLVEELTKPLASEELIHKSYRSSFEGTTLDDVLAKLKVSHLVVTGGETNNCVRHTSHAAIERGYDVTLVSDAHTTVDGAWGIESVKAQQVVAEQNGSFAQYELPGRSSNVQSTREIVF